MKILLILIGVTLLLTGNLIMNEYEHDSATTLGILLIALGISGMVTGIMMTQPL